ncbi:MAG: hypothetical protein ACXWF2_11055 [Usitatibacter sp.]
MATSLGTGNDDGAAIPHDWRSILAAASTEEEILQFVRGHLARWGAEELASLPPECRPGRIRDAEDISRWAFELASTHCAAAFEMDGMPVLDEMLDFATAAAARLSKVQAAQAGRPED